eukprot:jgi/Chrzof1/9411/Cz04g02030.t1
MSGVEETLERVSKHKGVLGLIVASNQGVIYKSTLDESLTQQYTSMIPGLTGLAKNMVRDLDPQNDLEFLRIRSAKHEIMVAPKDDYVLVVIQDPSAASA